MLLLDLHHISRRFGAVQALSDVSLTLPPGVIGLVGNNGAGKSTLLKILARITDPTEGEAVLRGRVGSLLEVGTGFHPELTGRENIYLSGSILGMRRADIRRRFDEIVAFAEVDRFLDTPVKRYSSGMQVRLGFAVAAHLEPDILVVDEVLAVGDSAFQQKCLAKMENVARGGRTVLFVSHNMAAVETLCRRAVVLEGGRVAEVGPAREAVASYLDRLQKVTDQTLADRADREGDGRLRFVALSGDLRTGHDSTIEVEYAAEPGLSNIEVSIGLFTPFREGAVYLGNAISGQALDDLPPSGRLRCRIPRCGLLPGRYTLNLYCTVNGRVADWVLDAAAVEVHPGDFFGTGRLAPQGYGSVLHDQHWSAT